MGNYKILSAEQGRTYDGKFGSNTVWMITLENAQAETPSGMFELHKKTGTQVEPGQTIEVERFIQGEFQDEPFVRIKQVYGGGGQSSGGDSKNFDRRPEHPRNEARMIHTSALSAAPGYINQMLALGFLEAPKDEESYWLLVSAVATRISKSYKGVLKAAEPTSEPSQQPLPQEVPADTTGLGNGSPAPATSDDAIPF